MESVKLSLPLDPDAHCPADQQLAGCKPSGSAQDDTAPGRSEQGSQKSSSSKGSSSQGSRPGSPSQGSPPGSSDDGWQVVTGRRRNKARGSRNK